LAPVRSPWVSANCALDFTKQYGNGMRRGTAAAKSTELRSGWGQDFGGSGSGGVAETGAGSGTMQYTRTCIRQSILSGANNRRCERKPKLSVLRNANAPRQDQKGSGPRVGSILLG